MRMVPVGCAISNKNRAARGIVSTAKSRDKIRSPLVTSNRICVVLYHTSLVLGLTLRVTEDTKKRSLHRKKNEESVEVEVIRLPYFELKRECSFSL